MKIVVFAGGRGAANIISALSVTPEVELSILVNAYDDGLSTGAIRSQIPGLLGPSDVRKNFSTLIKSQGDHGFQLSKLLEYRIHETSPNLSDWTIDDSESCERFLESFSDHLTVRQDRSIKDWLSTALVQFAVGYPAENAKNLSDMSVGNLLFAGAFLHCNNKFNEAIEMWSETFGILPHKIINVTEGENLVIVGVKEDGQILASESQIVESQNSIPIQRIFLLNEYPSENELSLLKSFSPFEIINWFLEREQLPNISLGAKCAIEEADLIVYGPGTQHSSLLPSYCTQGLSDIISSRSDIEKIFISNLSADYDIQSENILTLLKKLEYYMNLGSSSQHSVSDYVTQCFVSTSQTESTPWGLQTITSDSSQVGIHLGQWSKNGTNHDGARVVNGLISLGLPHARSKMIQRFHDVSIVVPVLNEVNLLPKVLHSLLTFDWLDANIIPEIIVVDGGSDDGSEAILDSFPTIRPIKLKNKYGRGAAISAGIEASNSQFIVTFPSDNEYSVEDISSIVKLLATGNTPIVFGSRTGRCADTDSRLRIIYGGRTRTYYFSKWGGQLLSVLSGVIYKRWISDTLTSVKGFTRDSALQLSMTGSSADWDMNIIRDASRNGIPIAEFPVQYVPRKIAEGKKINTKDGLRALKALIVGRFRF